MGLISGTDRVALWGLGKEGLALLQWLEKQPLGDALVMVVDEKDIPVDYYERIRAISPNAVVVKDPQLLLDEAITVLLKTPGVSIYHKVVVDLQSQGCRLESSTSLWLADDAHTRKIAVTATKGKSTTSSIIAHILGKGERVLLAGNIGKCPLGVCYSDFDTVVFEVSSFQLASLNGQFDYSVILNLEPEHLDWHGSFDRYRSDKLGVAARTKNVVVVAQDLVGQLPVTSARVVAYSKDPDHLEEIRQKLLSTSDIPSSLHLQHNLSNLSAALCLLSHIGVDATYAIQSLSGFVPLRHRQFVIGVKNAVRYIDDSICTNPLAGMAALRAYQSPDTVIIVGGYDRGLALEHYADELAAANLAGVVLLHQTGLRLQRLLSERNPNFTYEYAATLEDAVSLAKTLCPASGTIILSPAAPSFGLFNNFEQRGQAFADIVGLPYSNSEY